jgi:long-chain acyl-CoA synthetase
MSYSEKFWKKNWDPHVKDIDPKEFETTYVNMIKQAFRDYPDKIALAYLGKEVTFKELDEMSNKFANMLIANGFKKGDVVGINLPNTIEYVVSLIGALRAGCIISGVSPLLSAMQIEYQLNDLGSGGKKVALVTLDAIFAGHITKIASKIGPTKLIITTSVGSFLPKMIQVLGKALGKIPKGKVTPLEGKTVLDFHKDVLKVDFSTDPPNIKINPDDIGWIQYTGGTTGPPKGAMLSHRNVASNILSISEWLQWEFGKGILCSGFPMFHIAGLTVAESAVYFGWTQILMERTCVSLV